MDRIGQCLFFETIVCSPPRTAVIVLNSHSFQQDPFPADCACDVHDASVIDKDLSTAVKGSTVCPFSPIPLIIPFINCGR